MDADEEFRALVAAFRRLGFDELVALELAEANVSPSYLRELVEKKGATLDQAARCVL